MSNIDDVIAQLEAALATARAVRDAQRPAELVVHSTKVPRIPPAHRPRQLPLPLAVPSNPTELPDGGIDMLSREELKVRCLALGVAEGEVLGKTVKELRAVLSERLIIAQSVTPAPTPAHIKPPVFGRRAQ